MRVTAVIPGRPVAKQRARTVNGHTYTPPKTRAYEELVAICAATASGSFAEGRLSVSVMLCSTTQLRGDLDNYAKSVLDGIVKGGLIGDDRQIRRLLIEEQPGAIEDVVYVTVEAL